MKAVLVGRGVAPGNVLDLAHDLPAHEVGEAAFLLREMARGFPRESVHVAVVDPGVGGRRQPIVIATTAGPSLVGPDNGVLVPLAEDLGIRTAYRIDVDRFPHRPRVGTTFDGRDVFAPAAALLALGARPSALGPPARPMPFSLPQAERSHDGARGQVLHVDRFGNLVTNVPSSWIPDGAHGVEISVGTVAPKLVPWVTSYEALGRGVLGTLGSSFGLVEVAIGEGRAADRFRARFGSRVVLRWRARGTVPGETTNTARPRKQR